jgi:hypothetical protein
MTLPDFVTGLELELELRLRPVGFERAELEAWAAAVWPLAEEDPDVIRWSEAFLASRWGAAGAGKGPAGCPSRAGGAA